MLTSGNKEILCKLIRTDSAGATHTALDLHPLLAEDFAGIGPKPAIDTVAKE